MFAYRKINPNVYGLSGLGGLNMTWILVAGAAALYFMPGLRRKVLGAIGQ